LFEKRGWFKANWEKLTADIKAFQGCIVSFGSGPDPERGTLSLRRKEPPMITPDALAVEEILLKQGFLSLRPMPPR